MEIIAIFKAVLALAFVVGLLLLTLWLMKYCQIKLQKNSIIRNLHKNNRLEIIENKKVDSKNSLLLIRRDNVEHLILLNPVQSTVIETKIELISKNTNNSRSISDTNQTQKAKRNA